MASQLVETSKGPIECVILGEGPAVLLIHGCSGGYQQGLIAAKLAAGHRFRFVALSRPGYRRTPLEVGDTPEAQADAYAALLDALEIPSAAIIGISGGGPSALQFALRHPQRCWALATLSAISKRLSRAELARCRSLFRRSLMTFSLAAELARPLIGAVTRRWRDQRVSKNLKFNSRARHRHDRLDITLGLLRNLLTTSLYKVGLQNDMSQLLTMPNYPLEEIAAPTFVLHGSSDRLVPLSHAERIANTVANAKLMAVKGGGHLFFATHGEQVVPAVIHFLKLCARRINFESKALSHNQFRDIAPDFLSTA